MLRLVLLIVTFLKTFSPGTMHKNSFSILLGHNLGGVLHELVDVDADGEDEDEEGYEETGVAGDEHVRPTSNNKTWERKVRRAPDSSIQKFICMGKEQLGK